MKCKSDGTLERYRVRLVAKGKDEHGDDKIEKLNLKEKLATQFEMKELGKLKYFLGIKVAYSKQVTWRSKKQNVVDRSSVEAKFRAMAKGICEGLYMRIILDGLKVKYEGPIKLFCDNNSAISIAHNLVKHDRTKHIKIDRHFIKEKDYTNPMLPINQHSIDRALQPPIPQPTENHVLWASFQNMPYDVTVDVLHSVFSEYGIVQKISIFEKNSQTQALIQYPDVTTATAAKNALEGHCIYDGGYCKLHLSYSRHTDINVKAFSNKSRDYTRPDYSVQVPATSWHNPHAFHAQVYGGQIPSWNPILSYMYGPATFPHQTYAVPPIPAYVLAQSNPMVPGFSPHMQAGYSGTLYKD
ncbi:Polypyrimidine tract-binding protein-like 1, partial [Mucuna pruriens]